MGIGHATSSNRRNKNKQLGLFKTNWRSRFAHGGSLRSKREGRGARPLSTKDSIHVVFKVNRDRLRHKSLRSPQCYRLALAIIQKYARRFSVRIEEVTLQGDHCHLLVRAPRRSRYFDFFRVVPGQIAQQFEREGLLTVTDTPGKRQSVWLHRPFSRVVMGYRGHKRVVYYIRLNEMEAQGKIPYRKERLNGLLPWEWKLLSG